MTKRSHWSISIPKIPPNVLTSISIQLPFKIEFIHVLESHQIKSVSSRLMLYTKLYHSLWLNPYLLSFHDQKSKWSFVAIWVTFAPFLEFSTPSSSANFLGSWHISGLKSKFYHKILTFWCHLKNIFEFLIEWISILRFKASVYGIHKYRLM